MNLGSLCLCFLVLNLNFVCEVLDSISCELVGFALGVYIYRSVIYLGGFVPFFLVNSFIVVSSARVYRSSGSDVSFSNGGVREID